MTGKNEGVCVLRAGATGEGGCVTARAGGPEQGVGRAPSGVGEVGIATLEGAAGGRVQGVGQRRVLVPGTLARRARGVGGSRGLPDKTASGPRFVQVRKYTVRRCAEGVNGGLFEIARR